MESLEKLGIEKTPEVMRAREKYREDVKKVQECTENPHGCKYFWSDGERTTCFKYNINGVRC